MIIKPDEAGECMSVGGGWGGGGVVVLGFSFSIRSAVSAGLTERREKNRETQLLSGL